MCCHGSISPASATWRLGRARIDPGAFEGPYPVLGKRSRSAVLEVPQARRSPVQGERHCVERVREAVEHAEHAKRENAQRETAAYDLHESSRRQVAQTGRNTPTLSGTN